MQPYKNLVIVDDIAFNSDEASLILEALYFFEAEKTFESEDDYVEWRNTLKKVEDLIKQRSE